MILIPFFTNRNGGVVEVTAQHDLILKQIGNEDILLITPNFLKLQFLKENKKLRQIKYMTLEEYKGHYFFSWDDKT